MRFTRKVVPKVTVRSLHTTTVLVKVGFWLVLAPMDVHVADGDTVDSHKLTIVQEVMQAHPDVVSLKYITIVYMQ